MIDHLHELSVLKDIAYLDPELNGDVEYSRKLVHPQAIWRQVREFVSSPCIVTIAVLLTVLILAADLPS